MPRRTKKEVLAAAQDPAAPFLFDELNLPVREDLVKAIRDGAHKAVHTGARLLDNHEKVLRMVELLLSGWGLRRISKDMHVSKWSVRAAREALIARGEMATFKQRVVAKFEDAIEQNIDNYQRALDADEVPPAQLPVGMGIIWDKRALALGEATSIAAVATGPAEDLSVEKINAWFAGLKQAKAAPLNPSISDLLPNSPENGGKEQPEPTTEPTTVSTMVDGSEVGNGWPDGQPDGPDGPAGGGGVAAAAAQPEGDPKVCEN